MPTINILHRWTGAVLYAHNSQASGLSAHDALEAASRAGADLRSADLSGANLRSADLSGADLRSANLSGADINGLLLVGNRPLMAIGPIGSEMRTVFAWITESGLRIQAGCFFGNREEFLLQLEDTHGSNAHAQEYKAALALFDVHAQLHTPTITPENAQ